MVVIHGGVIWVAWLPTVVAVAFFPMPVHPSAVEGTKGLIPSSINLVPLRASFRSLSHLRPGQIVRDYGGNLLLLAQVTLLLPALWRQLRSWKWAFAVGVGVSLAIELLQFGFSALVGYGYRAVDIDDVILNSVGALVGYALFLVACRLMGLDPAAIAPLASLRPGAD